MYLVLNMTFWPTQIFFIYFFLNEVSISEFLNGFKIAQLNSHYLYKSKWPTCVDSQPQCIPSLNCRGAHGNLSDDTSIISQALVIKFSVSMKHILWVILCQSTKTNITSPWQSTNLSRVVCQFVHQDDSPWSCVDCPVQQSAGVSVVALNVPH